VCSTRMLSDVLGGSVRAIACCHVSGTWLVFGYRAWGWVVPDRLLVDLGGDGQAGVLSWPEGGLPEEVSRAPLKWPLDADALEDLRWYLEDYLQGPYGVWEERGPSIREKLTGDRK